MTRRFALSALAGLPAAVASLAAAAPPTYTYVELHRFAGSTIPQIELSLNDRAEIARTEVDSFENEKLWIRSPQGFIWNPVVTGVDLTDVALGKLGDDGTATYTIKHAAPDPRFQSVATWKAGSPALEIASALYGSAESFEQNPDRNEAGQLAFWRLASAFGLMRWTAGTLEQDVATAAFMTRTLIAPDGEMFFERRASAVATSSTINRVLHGAFTPFVSAADFGGVAGVHVPIDLNAAKTLLFRRVPGTSGGIDVYFKTQGGTPVLVGTTTTCGDSEINDQSQILCVTTSGITLRNTSDLAPHTVVAPPAFINGTTVEALGVVASLNDLGQVAFTARLANGDAGIYLATPSTCDSDGDGWCDAYDLCPTFAETTQRDTDRDGLGDRCDNCPFHANPDQADSNGDLRGDVCGPCLPSGLPRCGTRVKGVADDVFTIANVPIDSLPPRPGMYLLAKTFAPGITLEATVTGCVGGNLSSNGSPVALYDGDGFQAWPVYVSYYRQQDRKGATCSFEFRATGPLGGTYTWLAESATIPIVGGETFYESDGSEVDATATAPNRATFTNETTNHRFLYAGTGGQSFGTCSFDPDPPTAQEPPVVYSSATGPGWDCCTFQFDGFDGVPSSVGQLVFDVNGAPPPPDPDNDGFLSPCDSCPNLFNTDQADRGRVGPGIGDGIGDACQCTELTGDGSVGSADVTRLRQHLAGIGAPLTGAPLSRCSAIGGPNECTVRTLSVLLRALLSHGPGVAQVCDAAVP